MTSIKLADDMTLGFLGFGYEDDPQDCCDSLCYRIVHLHDENWNEPKLCCHALEMAASTLSNRPPEVIVYFDCNEVDDLSPYVPTLSPYPFDDELPF